MVLASTPDVSLDKLAEMADKIMEVAAPAIASAATPSVSAANTPPPLAAEVNHLHSEVTRLEKLVQRLASTQSLPCLSPRSQHLPLTPTNPATTTSTDSYC